MKISSSVLRKIIRESIECLTSELLCEISIQDKYQKEASRHNMDYDAFERICLIDPTSRNNQVGKYANWLLRYFPVERLNDNGYIEGLRRRLEYFNDGVKRGILARYDVNTDINSYKGIDELSNIIDSVMNDTSSSMSNSQMNHINTLKGQYKVLGEDSNFMVINPLTFEAERFFGSGTQWCTVANEKYFNDYTKDGKLYIIYPKNGDSLLKSQFHYESRSYANYSDDVYPSPIKCLYESYRTKVADEILALCKKAFKGVFPDCLWMWITDENIQGLLDSGYDYNDLFYVVEDAGVVDESILKVQLDDGRWNYIKDDIILCADWFDEAGNFEDPGLALVKSDNGYNFIDEGGDYLVDFFFDSYEKESFSYDGTAVIKKDDKYAVLTSDGEIFGGIWFDKYSSAGVFTGVFTKGGKCVIMTPRGFSRWYDSIKGVDWARFVVEDKGKFSIIDTLGNNVLYDTWFDDIKGTTFAAGDCALLFEYAGRCWYIMLRELTDNIGFLKEYRNPDVILDLKTKRIMKV